MKKSVLSIGGTVMLSGFGLLASAEERSPPRPAAAARTAAPAQPARTAAVAAPSTTPVKAKANPRGLPLIATGVDRIKAIIEYQKQKRAELKTFGCPPSVTVAAGTGLGPATLAFTSARVASSQCPTSTDMAPVAERGGRCLECNYQYGVQLERSGPKSHSCWVKPDAKDNFVCEYVPPVPASQTCVFQIDPGPMDLYAFANHTRGDSDLYTEGSLFDPGSTAVIELSVKLARTGNKLVWKLSGEAKETAPDHTTFSGQKTIDLKSSDIKNGSVADIETCLAAYGTQRPFAEPSITREANYSWEGWLEFGSYGSELLQMSWRCRADTAGSDTGQVGCKDIDVEPFTLNLK
jgi:hypothetical protein